MANVMIDDKHLNDIAEAIRSKNGTTDTYKPSEMADAITAIPTDGFNEYPIYPKVIFGCYPVSAPTTSASSYTEESPEHSSLILLFDTSKYSDKDFTLDCDIDLTFPVGNDLLEAKKYNIAKFYWYKNPVIGKTFNGKITINGQLDRTMVVKHMGETRWGWDTNGRISENYVNYHMSIDSQIDNGSIYYGTPVTSFAMRVVFTNDYNEYWLNGAKDGFGEVIISNATIKVPEEE